MPGPGIPCPRGWRGERACVREVRHWSGVPIAFASRSRGCLRAAQTDRNAPRMASEGYGRSRGAGGPLRGAAALGKRSRLRVERRWGRGARPRSMRFMPASANGPESLSTRMIRELERAWGHSPESGIDPRLRCDRKLSSSQWLIEIGGALPLTPGDGPVFCWPSVKLKVAKGGAACLH